MTTEQRQQSLENARVACDWLNKYIDKWDKMREPIDCLIAEFERLDAKEQKQIRAGKRYGKLGAEHGKKGGRPRKNKQGNGSHSYKSGEYEITRMADGRWGVYLNGEDTGRDYPTLREARKSTEEK